MRLNRRQLSHQVFVVFVKWRGKSSFCWWLNVNFKVCLNASIIPWSLGGKYNLNLFRLRLPYFLFNFNNIFYYLFTFYSLSCLPFISTLLLSKYSMDCLCIFVRYTYFYGRLLDSLALLPNPGNKTQTLIVTDLGVLSCH